MAENGPCDITVLELLDGDFTGECTVRAVEDVLGRDFDVGCEVFAGDEEVEGRRGDYDFGVGTEFGG